VKNMLEDLKMGSLFHDPSLEFAYAIALVNNFSKSYDYTDEMNEKLASLEAPYSVAQLPVDEVKSGWQNLIKLGRAVLIDQMLAVLKEDFDQLYQGDWMTSTKIVRTIVDTLRDFFTADIADHMISAYAQKLAKELFDRVVSCYVRQIFVKKNSFKKESADRLDEDVSELGVYFRETHDVRDKVATKTIDVLTQLGKLMRTRDLRQIKTIVQAIQSTNSDVALPLMEALFKMREGLDSEELKEFLKVVKETFQDWQAPPRTEAGHFSGVKASGGGGFVDKFLS